MWGYAGAPRTRIASSQGFAVRPLQRYPLKGRVCKGGLFAIQYSPIPV